MRIVLENSDYQAVGFHVPVAQMHTAQSLVRDKRIPPPGSDVLSSDFDPVAAAMRRVLAHGNEEIGDVLLHQEVLAGVGNVFKSEICFVDRRQPVLQSLGAALRSRLPRSFEPRAKARCRQCP